jgi:hypothetical protein
MSMPSFARTLTCLCALLVAGIVESLQSVVGRLQVPSQPHPRSASTAS